jgi:DNA repair exonuclease SbcCD nuclease subunit
MPRVSLLYRTDTHLCDRSPSSWKADYPAEIWSNLRQIGAFSKEHEVKAVLDGGDYFHIKAASRNPHAIVVETASVHNTYGVPTYCVEGNHDIAYNRLDSVAGQPLGVLYETGVFRHLRSTVFEDGGMRVRVVGVPYSANRTADDLRAIQKQPGDDFLVAIVHSLAGEEPPPNVREFFNEPVFRYDQLVTKDGPDVWCFGHWHKDQGIVQLGGKQFVNLGAVSRGALINENLQRSPKVALLGFEPGRAEITPLLLSVAPASEVFDLERKERAEREHENIDQFIERLQSEASFDVSQTIEANIQGLSFASDVKQLAIDYLERARAETGVG